MSYNGSGTFNLYTPGNPVVTGTTISSSWANSTLSDIATGLSTAICKDGQTTVTGNIPLAGFKLTGLGAGTARTDAPQLAQVQNSTATLIGTVAGTNTITGVMTPTLTAYGSGQSFVLTPANANTGATTLNIDSLGAKNVFCGGAACVGGELFANSPVIVEYDGTQFNIVGGGVAISYTGTLTGCTTAPTGTITGRKTGNQVTLNIPLFTATSNTVAKTVTGMSAAFRPATQKSFLCVTSDNGGAFVVALMRIETTGDITYFVAPNGGAWTASGVATMNAISVSYTTV